MSAFSRACASEHAGVILTPNAAASERYPRPPGSSTLLHDVLDHVLRYVGRQYGLQAVQDLLGIQHVGLVALALRSAPQGVHDAEEAAGSPLEVLLEEPGGRYAHHSIHACWFQLAGFGVARQELVAAKDVLDHLLGVGHGRSLEQG
jgi:hypothetical protein